MITATPSAHVVLHSLGVRPLGPGHRRKRRLIRARAHAAGSPDDEASTEAPGGGAEQEPEATPSSSESLTVTKMEELKPAAGFPSLSKDYSRTLFRSECLEVLGLVDLKSLRKRPRLTVGVTVKASVVLPVLVVLAVLYLTDMAKEVVDWTHHLEDEDVGE